jgi:hypothetical protein
MHAYPASQGIAVVVTHVPEPSHVCCAFALVAVGHDEGTQTEPEAQYRHAPAPSQKPSRPQLVIGAGAHDDAPADERFFPFCTLPQVPLARPVSVARQELHGPAHAASQQTPSTQLSLAQLTASVHALPLASLGTQKARSSQ